MSIKKVRGLNIEVLTNGYSLEVVYSEWDRDNSKECVLDDKLLVSRISEIISGSNEASASQADADKDENPNVDLHGI